MFTITLDGKEKLQKKVDYYPEYSPDSVQIVYRYIFIVYEPISKGKGKIKLFINIDFKLTFVPLFIQEWVFIKIGQDFFKNNLHIATEYEGSKWEQKTKEDPSTFLFNEAIIKRHISKLEEKKQQDD